jgi:hypothetical protein
MDNHSYTARVLNHIYKICVDTPPCSATRYEHNMWATCPTFPDQASRNNSGQKIETYVQTTIVALPWQAFDLTPDAASNAWKKSKTHHQNEFEHGLLRNIAPGRDFDLRSKARFQQVLGKSSMSTSQERLSTWGRKLDLHKYWARAPFRLCRNTFRHEVESWIWTSIAPNVDFDLGPPLGFYNIK